MNVLNAVLNGLEFKGENVDTLKSLTALMDESAYDYSDSYDMMFKVLYGGLAVATVARFVYEQFRSDGSNENIPNSDDILTQADVLRKLQEEEKALKNGDTAPLQQSQLREKVLQSQKNILQYRHEMFAPGAAKEIEDAIGQAKKFTDQGAAQAAASAWYQAFLLTRNTEKSILAQETQWEAFYLDYLTLHGQIRDTVTRLKAFPLELTTTEGKETVSLDVDHWTRGALSALAQTLPGEKVKRDCPMQELNSRCGQLRDAQLQMQELSAQAVQAFMDSQQRMELCDAVYQAFSDRGWELDGESQNGFEEDDMRKDVHLTVCNAVRDQVRFTFSGDGKIGVSVGFRDVYNKNLTGYLAGILRQALNENHFTIAQMTTVPQGGR